MSYAIALLAVMIALIIYGIYKCIIQSFLNQKDGIPGWKAFVPVLGWIEDYRMADREKWLPLQIIGSLAAFLGFSSCLIILFMVSWSSMKHMGFTAKEYYRALGLASFALGIAGLGAVGVIAARLHYAGGLMARLEIKKDYGYLFGIALFPGYFKAKIAFDREWRFGKHRKKIKKGIHMLHF